MSTLARFYSDHFTFRVSLWFLWGFATKFIDLHFDDGLFRRRHAYLAAVLCGVSVGFFMAVDTDTMIIYGAIITSCLLSGKVDNGAFQLSTALIVLTIAGVHFTRGLGVHWSLPGLAAFLIMTVGFFMDEVLNNHLDRTASGGLRAEGRALRLLRFFLRHRCGSVVCDLCAIAIGGVRILSWLQAGIFNGGYYLMHWYGAQRLQQDDGSLHASALTAPGSVAGSP